ncbi:MAG: hypothetical protein AAGD14_14495, partial [Planctomycetota bacterium]
MIRPILIATTMLAAFVAPRAEAQQGQMDAEKMKQKMDEISQLMRESERLLLEMTKVDRLVEQQRRIAEELEKLRMPEQPAGGGTQEQPNEQQPNDQQREQEKRRQLQEKQNELKEKLQRLFENQQQAGQQSASQLAWLLRNLPRGGQGSSPQPQGNEPQQPDKPRPDQEEKGKQDEPGDEREQKDNETKPDREKQRERDQESQLNRIEQWIARLPPAQQERINRNDFSGFPSRYRRASRSARRRVYSRRRRRYRDGNPEKSLRLMRSCCAGGRRAIHC